MVRVAAAVVAFVAGLIAGAMGVPVASFLCFCLAYLLIPSER